MSELCLVFVLPEIDYSIRAFGMLEKKLTNRIPRGEALYVRNEVRFSKTIFCFTRKPKSAVMSSVIPDRTFTFSACIGPWTTMAVMMAK